MAKNQEEESTSREEIIGALVAQVSQEAMRKKEEYDIALEAAREEAFEQSDQGQRARRWATAIENNIEKRHKIADAVRKSGSEVSSKFHEQLETLEKEGRYVNKTANPFINASQIWILDNTNDDLVKEEAYKAGKTYKQVSELIGHLANLHNPHNVDDPTFSDRLHALVRSDEDSPLEIVERAIRERAESGQPSSVVLEGLETILPQLREDIMALSADKSTGSSRGGRE